MKRAYLNGLLTVSLIAEMTPAAYAADTAPADTTIGEVKAAGTKTTEVKPSEFKPIIAPVAELFMQYTDNLKSGEEGLRAFEVTRASVGARAKLTPHLGGGIMLEASRYGSYSVSVPTYSIDSSGALVSTPGEPVLWDRGNNRLTMFVKRAAFEVDNIKNSGVKVSFGMITSPWPIYEENIWGLRYIAGAFTDFWRMGHTVDIGASVNGNHLGGLIDYQFNVVDGEGPRKTNTDNQMQYQARFTIAPLVKNPTLKTLKLSAYADYGNLDLEGHYRMSTFASASIEHPFITGYVGLYRIDYHEVVSSGISNILVVSPIKGGKAFARLDVVDPDAEVEKDGQRLLIVGVGYDLYKGMSASLDAQLKMFEDTEKEAESVIALHTRLAF